MNPNVNYTWQQLHCIYKNCRQKANTPISAGPALSCCRGANVQSALWKCMCLAYVVHCDLQVWAEGPRLYEIIYEIMLEAVAVRADEAYAGVLISYAPMSAAHLCNTTVCLSATLLRHSLEKRQISHFQIMWRNWKFEISHSSNATFRSLLL